MDNYGFIRVGAAVPKLKVANTIFNADEIITMIKDADHKNVQIVCFPELCLTGYTCGDLFHQDILLKNAIIQLQNILNATSKTSIVAILGIPIYTENQLFNCSAVIQKGQILGIVAKTFIPGYNEFYEERWFAQGLNAKNEEIFICGQTVPFGTNILFEDNQNKNICFGVEICEDLWAPYPPKLVSSNWGCNSNIQFICKQ